MLTCDINGLTLVNSFKFGQMKVDVLENWSTHEVVGVLGMDILSKMTFILSHKHKKFLLTDNDLPEISTLFCTR